MSDDALIGVLKDAAKLTGDTDRAEGPARACASADDDAGDGDALRRAAGGIKSDDERAGVQAAGPAAARKRQMKY